MKRLFWIILFSLIPTFLIWTPFIARIPSFWNIPLPTNGLATIIQNYDGPLYLIVAKKFYDLTAIGSTYQFPLPNEYYTAHFPLFPILIKLFGTFTNYPYAMLTATLLSSVLAIYFFHKIISDYVDKKSALFLTLAFSIFPARWLIVRSVGSADPLFVAAIAASLYFFKKEKYFWAAIWGAIAQLTKSPGILLFISYAIYFLVKKDFNIKKYFSLILIPLTLLGIFIMYYFLTGDFFIYFHSGDNIHLFALPFQIFNYSAPWVGTFWLEDIIFVYLIGAIGVYKLLTKKEYAYGIFAAVFFLLTLFVAHRDIIRYSLPLVPFLYVAYSDFLAKKEFKIALAIIAIPIYLFSLAFISQNAMPISNWTPFL